MGLMERVMERIETTARLQGGRREGTIGRGGVERVESLTGLLERMESLGWPKEPRADESVRMLELEAENVRLTRLVAELLLKNQQLRESN